MKKLNRIQRQKLIRIILSIALILPALLIKAEGIWAFMLFMPAYILIAYDTLIKAAKGIVRGQAFDENFLMAVATVGALALGEYSEAIAVMLFYQTGELFESIAVSRSRKSIAQLMDIRPEYANVPDGSGGYTQIEPESITVGMELLVLAGERVPVDGLIISGSSSLDCSALTGESMPRELGEGDEIISGCINLSSPLSIVAQKEYGQSTVARVLELVENASSRKSRSENFITRFAAVYTPAVCISALLLALLPPVICMFMGVPAQWGKWIYRALSFLVISCPCALVISVPLSFFAAIGGAGRAGVLVKGSNYMEALSKVDCVALDKTGTLTKGEFSLVEVKSEGLSADELLELAAHAESLSLHPISRSIVSAYGKPLNKELVEDVRELAGKGILARVCGKEAAFGNLALMKELGVAAEEISAVGTVIYAAVDARYVGYLRISDTLKPNSVAAIEKLRSIGVKQLMLLTGDSERVGENIAKELGIDKAFCSLLPQDKLEIVEKELENKKGGLLAFVGDGINDAPVLSRADVGIAMGALGSDAAIEAADVVLMDDDPEKIAKAIAISSKCMKIVYQNIFFAIGVKLMCLLLSVLGLAGMWLAIFADVGVMVLAVLNAVRAMNIKKL